MQGVTVPEEVGSLSNPWILELGGISWHAEPDVCVGNVIHVFYFSRNLSRLPLTLGIPRSPHPSLPKRADFSQLGAPREGSFSRECRVHVRDGCARRV